MNYIYLFYYMLLDSMEKNFHVALALWTQRLDELEDELEDPDDAPSIEVMCEFSHDESGLLPSLEYDERTGKLVGSCGRKGTEGAPHKCTFDDEVDASGSGQACFDAIIETLATRVIGSYASIAILSPLHPGLPAVVVHLTVTCNRFDADPHGMFSFHSFI